MFKNKHKAMKNNKIHRKQHIQHPQRSIKAGLPPGSLIYVGKEHDKEPDIYSISFNEKETEEKSINIQQVTPANNLPSDKVNWLMINGLNNIRMIEQLGEKYELDSLILEDILNTDQRPKFDELEDYIFLTIKTLTFDPHTISVNSEQVSLITGRNYVISFQENHDPVFNAIIERIRTARGKIRLKQSDYLMYTLIDVIVDNYFAIIETIGQNIEDLEDEVYINPGKDKLQLIQLYKKALLTLQKHIFPLRDEIGSLIKSETDQISPANKKYFRDIFDHLFHMVDSIENQLEINAGIKDIYLSNLSLKMNQIMQILTIFTAVFTPLTFIVGVYGMNFANMPELTWHYGYFAVWGLLTSVGLGLFIYFKKKKWL
jgi:magnesium transporter